MRKQQKQFSALTAGEKAVIAADCPGLLAAVERAFEASERDVTDASAREDVRPLLQGGISSFCHRMATCLDLAERPGVDPELREVSDYGYWTTSRTLNATLDCLPSLSLQTLRGDYLLLLRLRDLQLSSRIYARLQLGREKLLEPDPPVFQSGLDELCSLFRLRTKELNLRTWRKEQTWAAEVRWPPDFYERRIRIVENAIARESRK